MESPMATAGFSSAAREACNKLFDRCFLLFPGLAEPGVLLFDASLIRKTRDEPWVLLLTCRLSNLTSFGLVLTEAFIAELKQYLASYLVVFVATLIQYFLTSASSPGCVIDAMAAENGTSSTFLIQSNSRNGNTVSSINENLLETQTFRLISPSWLKHVMDLYPPGSAIRTWTCTYCNVVQPPRAKHCHDCDKCILQFDHHCVWLGTCVGRENHCRFWWYIFEETVLCIWTVVLYISLLRSKIMRAWWKGFIVILLLAILIFCLIFLLMLLIFHSYLALTNQTTYEKVRRRRILYMRGIPEKISPFSRGICNNLFTFCCSRESIYTLEAVPSMADLEEKARPYTCLDIVSCRCC